MNHKLSDSQLEEMIKSAVNSSGPLPPDEKFSQLVSALRELQERRKAAMDSEPYGFTDGDRRGMIYKPEHSDRLSEPVPVYRHAQPAPAVPDEMTPEQAHEIGDYYGDQVDVFARGANWMRQHIIDSTLAAAQQEVKSE